MPSSSWAWGFVPGRGTALGFFSLGVAVWTWLEYTVHRHVLHGRFPDGPGWLRHHPHRFFDTMHGDHHLRPWDGMYINGFLDSLPFAAAFALVSLLAPLPTAPVMVAGLLECYHLYHHSPRGGDIAFGLTSGLWDAVLGTRIPPIDRRLLYARGCRGWRTPTPSVELRSG